MTTSKMVRYAIPAALVAGGVTFGTMFSPIGLAAAESTDEGDNSGEANVEERSKDGSDDRKSHRWGRRGARIDAVTESLGLTAEQVGEGLDAGKSLADLALEQDVPVEDLQADLVAAANLRLDEAVAEGTLDAERADEIREGLDEKVDEWINRTPGDGEGRGKGQKGKGRSGAGLLKGGSEEVSELLGLDTEEIRVALSEGNSLADIAEQQDVPVEDLAAVLAANAIERIDSAVEEEKITEEQATEAKEGLDERIDEFLDKEFDGEGRQQRGEGRRGKGGETDQPEEEESEESV